MEYWDISSPADPVKHIPVFQNIEVNSVTAMSLEFSESNIFALDGEQRVFHSWDISDPAIPVHTQIELNSGYHYVSLSDDFRDSERHFSIESVSGSRCIYLPSGNDIEIFQASDGVLSALDYIYVGVPLKGVYKFSGDPYLYALGYKTINVVSIGE